MFKHHFFKRIIQISVKFKIYIKKKKKRKKDDPKIKIFSNPGTFHYNCKILMNSSVHSYYLRLQSIKQHDELLVTKSVYRPIIIFRIRNLFPELSREELELS